MNSTAGMMQLMVGSSTGGKQAMKLLEKIPIEEKGLFSSALSAVMEQEMNKEIGSEFQSKSSEFDFISDEELLLKMIETAFDQVKIYPEEIPQVMTVSLEEVAELLQNTDEEVSDLLGVPMAEVSDMLGASLEDVAKQLEVSLQELLEMLETSNEQVFNMLANSYDNGQKTPALLAESFEEAIEIITQLLDELPIGEGFLSEDMLKSLVDVDTSDDKLSLLKLIPDHWAKEIEVLFDNKSSLEVLLEDVQHRGNPVSLLALLIGFVGKEEQGFTFDNPKGIQVMQQVVTAFFPGLQKDENIEHFRQIIAKLNEYIGNRESTFSNSKLSSRTHTNKSFMNTMNTTKFAELAYLNQLAKSDGNKAISQNLQAPIIIDSTNSHMSRLQQFMIHNGEQQAERPSQEQFIRQFQNLLSRSSFQQLGQGIQQLSLKLHPASLGRLDITIQQVNGVMTASMMTTTAATRELIEGQLSQLRSAFQAQNIHVDKIEVTQQQNQQQQLLKDPSQDEAKKDEENRQERDEQFEEDETEEDLEFADFLAETINTEA